MKSAWICLSLLVLGATTAFADLGTQLEAHYPLDADASDASGNGQDGTIDGAVGAPNLRNIADRALAFDGVDDDVTVPTLGNWGTDLSFSLWTFVNSSGSGAARTLLGSREVGSGATQINFFLQVTDADLVVFRIVSDEGNSELTTMAPIDLDRWVHIVADWSSSTDQMRIFFDGELVAEGAVGGTPRYRNDDIGLGNFCSGCGTDSSFDGRIDEVRIYSRRLGDDEIASLSTLAHYALDGDATDASGHGEDGTLFGPVPATDPFGSPDSAYSFDGADDLIDVPSLRNWGPELGFSLWVYVDPAGDGQARTLIGSRASGSGATLLNLNFAVDSSGTLTFTVASNATFSSLSTAQTVPTGRWVALACDWSENTNTMRIFIDGEPAASGPVGGTPRYRSDTLGIGNFGAGYSSTQAPFLGLIDDVRIVNHELREGEIPKPGIFSDGFESGDTTTWSSTVGLLP